MEEIKYGIGRFTNQKQNNDTLDFEKVFRQIERSTKIKTMTPKQRGGKRNTQPTRYCYLNDNLNGT